MSDYGYREVVIEVDMAKWNAAMARVNEVFAQAHASLRGFSIALGGASIAVESLTAAMESEPALSPYTARFGPDPRDVYAALAAGEAWVP
jgi:hypothetical protein